jgi:DNA helicase-2/ATP-dependent DNA helicase PcrA
MVAGAGSGKTTSLVKALAHLGATRGADLVRNGQNIACVTYTEVAAGEIFGDVRESPLFHVSTIHSFLWRLIRPFQSDIRAWVKTRITEKIADAQSKVAAPRSQPRTKAKATADITRYQTQLNSIDGVDKFVYGMGSDFSEGVLGHDDVLKIGPALILQYPLLRVLIARRYPYIFVDESQDTDPSVVAALKEIAKLPNTGFCLGFFGDPMQKIYMAGAGAITAEEGWSEITKPENFRSSRAVLHVINRIRVVDDGLEQTAGIRVGPNGPAPILPGAAKLFLFPSNVVDRTACVDQVRAWMATSSGDPLWVSDAEEDDVKLLVLVHRIAARRLGFEDIYAALNDNGAPGFSEGLQEGSAWAVRPFLTFVLPIGSAVASGNQFEVISILRRDCPRLNKERVAKGDAPAILAQLQQDVTTLAGMLNDRSTSTVREVLNFVQQHELCVLDPRFADYLVTGGGDPEDPYTAAMTALLACPVVQMWGYARYIQHESPFATQQGVKGAQFERVLAILDDEESNYNIFSYEKYWGIENLSKTDKENIASGKDSVVERTRRLFYVSCSRAVRDLAVTFFVSDLAVGRAAVERMGIFSNEDVIELPFAK